MTPMTAHEGGPRAAAATEVGFDPGDADPDEPADPLSAAGRRAAPRIRLAAPADVPALRRLSKRVYPRDPWWCVEARRLMGRFPEGGVLLCEGTDGELIGAAASLRLRWRRHHDRWSYLDMIGDWTFDTHDPAGETLYGIEVMVDPRARRRGVGSALYASREALAGALGLLRVRACARLPGYHLHADRMSAQRYVRSVVRGELTDPTLSFQLALGYRAVRVVAGYLPDDAPSLGHACLIDKRVAAAATSWTRVGGGRRRARGIAPRAADSSQVGDGAARRSAARRGDRSGSRSHRR